MNCQLQPCRPDNLTPALLSYSPLAQSVTREGKSVQVEIYEDGKGDRYRSSTAKLESIFR